MLSIHFRQNKLESSSSNNHSYTNNSSLLLNYSTSKNWFNWLSNLIAFVNSILFFVEPTTTCQEKALFDSFHKPYQSLTSYQTTVFWTCPNSKHFQNDNLNVPEMAKIVFHGVEIILGKGENAFYLFLTMFSKGFFPRVIETHECMVMG